MTAEDCLQITVPYNPIATARPRSFVLHGRIQVYDKQRKQRNEFSRALVYSLKQKYGKVPFFKGPVELSLIFNVKRPVSHYGTGRNSDKVKPSAPAYPTRSDVDNYCKFVMDCLNKQVFPDDRHVVRLIAEKRFSETGSVEIQVKSVRIGD